VAALLGAASCTREASGDPAAVATADTTAVNPLRAVARALVPRGAYRVVAVSRPGTIRGVVRPDHLPARHDATLAADDDDASVCGTRVPDGSVYTDGHGLGNALVWVSDARRGLAPPRPGRVALAVRRCQVEPRVLALGAGTTIDFRSMDATEHHTRFVNVLADSLLGHMLTVDRWAVVPSARIAAAPGLVEVEGAAHAFTRGYLAIFDNPYFAVTDRHGRFTIRGLPAGTYHLRVWHERGAAIVDSAVTVPAGKSVALDVELAIRE